MATLGTQQVPTPACPPDIVGNAFVHQYYHILHQSPEHVHRFYQEISSLGRPEENGMMSITSTLQAIDKKILALGYGVLSAEIATVDTQESYGGGVLVLVSGYLTGKDSIRRTFSQTFFLAPQETGYFVLNDMLRYIDEGTVVHGTQIPEPLNTHHSPAATQDIADEQENGAVEQSDVLSKSVNDPEVFNSSENGQVSATEEAPAPEIVHEAVVDVQKVGESDSSTGEVPKRSYASIVKVMKENAAPLSATRTPAKLESKRQEEQVPPISLAPPLPEKPDSGTNAAVNGNHHDFERAVGPSIYLKGLPLDATPALIENECQRFGVIRSNGIQVRSQKGFCFGFVEFESASSMQNAIEASPIIINGQRVIVEEKRSTSRGHHRGRSSFGAGSGAGTGYRNEGGRVRGGFGGGRGYGRSEYGNGNGNGNGYGNGNGNGNGSRGSNRGGGNGYGRGRRGGPPTDSNGPTKPVAAPRVGSVTA